MFIRNSCLLLLTKRDLYQLSSFCFKKLFFLENHGKISRKKRSHSTSSIRIAVKFQLLTATENAEIDKMSSVRKGPNLFY